MNVGRTWCWVGGVSACLVVGAALARLAPDRAEPESPATSDWVLGQPTDPVGEQAVSVALAPDGRRLAVGTRAGWVAVWDVDPRRLLWRWAAHPGAVTSVAFAPDGEVLLTAGRDKVLRLWTLSNADPVLRSETPTPATVLGAAFAPDGRGLLTGSDGGATWWRIGAAGPVPVAEAPVPGWPVHAVAVSPTGDRVAFSGGDNWVRLWQPEASGEAVPVAVSEEYQVRGLAFTPGGRGLVVLDTDGRVLRWDLDTGGRRSRQLTVPTCRSAAFTPDLRWAVIGHHVGTARVVALRAGPEEADDR